MRITAFTLKMIAVITMFIDHVAVVFLERAAAAGNIAFVNDNIMTFGQIDMVMRFIGRMSFPLFAFLLVEGFTKTRSVPKYALRLLIFAIISEIPYDMALSFRETNLAAEGFWGKYLPLMNANNVMITLLIGLLLIWAIDAMAPFFTERQQGARSFGWTIYQMLVMLAALFVAMVISFFAGGDYGAAGIISIFLMYILKDYPKTGFTAAVIFLTLFTSSMEIVALLMLIPIHFYKGEKGRSMKYFFYAFYPAHLLVLACIALCIGLPLFTG